MRICCGSGLGSAGSEARATAEDIHSSYDESLPKEFSDQAVETLALATATQSEALLLKWLVAKPPDLKDKVMTQMTKFEAAKCTLSQMHKAIYAAGQKAQR